MVVSSGMAQAMNRADTEQRFNVAASRARDRMYLVRSVEFADLSERDLLRRGLIQHFRAPFANDEQKIKALSSISTELARQGKVEEALSCASGISTDWKKSQALSSISTELAKQGFYVLGGVRRESQFQDLEARSIFPLLLDVTKPEHARKVD